METKDFGMTAEMLNESVRKVFHPITGKEVRVDEIDPDLVKKADENAAYDDVFEFLFSKEALSKVHNEVKDDVEAIVV